MTGQHLETDDAIGATERVAARITFVTSHGCHFCRDAETLLDELASQYPLEVTEIDLTSAEGRSIALRWRVPFPPVILIDGEYHGHGRISRRKLTKALETVTGGA